VWAVCCVGSGLWDELIVHIEESYRLCVCVCVCVCVCPFVCDLETSTTKLSRPDLGCCATKKEIGVVFVHKMHCVLYAFFERM